MGQEIRSDDVEIRHVGALLDAIPAHVAVLSPDGTIIAVNQQWRRFAAENGGEPEGSVGTNYLAVTECAGADPSAGAVLAGLRAVLSGGRASFELEYPCHSADRRRWFRCLVATLGRGDDGPMDGVLVMHIDITETRLAQEAAQAASIAKSRFLATMSHELVTPLNTLLGAAQLLAMTELTADQRELLQIMTRGGQSLHQLLGDVLDLTRVEAGRMAFEKLPFSPLDLAQEALDMVRLRAAEKHLELRLDISPGLPATLLGDAKRLRQILLNLLGNAVKFTERGRVRLNMALSVESGRSSLVASVDDTGIGMAADVIDRVFERFVQGDNTIARRFGGSGLGLAICRELAEAMGGDITIHSRPLQGTRVVVRLPTDQAPTPLAPPAANPQDVGEPLRLLLVEDEPAGRLVLTSLLESLGHQVVATEDACAGLRAAVDQPLDAALVDIQLPGLDGFALRRLLTTLHRPARLPVLALTANAGAADRRAYDEAGFDGMLAKPVLRETLARGLAALPAGTAAAGRPDLLDEAPLQRMLADIGAPRLSNIVTNAKDTITSVTAEMSQRPELPQLARLAHKLKGCAAMVGLPWLARLAERTEAAARQGLAAEGEDGRLLCLVVGAASLARLSRWAEAVSPD
jgi:signal transduction histidine kinase/CheY-like chemotaxis protein